MSTKAQNSRGLWRQNSIIQNEAASAVGDSICRLRVGVSVWMAVPACQKQANLALNDFRGLLACFFK